MKSRKWMLLGDICTEYDRTVDGEEEEEEEEEEEVGGSDGDVEGGGSCGDNGDDNDEGDGDEGETKWGADEVDMLSRVGVPWLLLTVAAPLLAGSLAMFPFPFPLADSICWAGW
jgi:hypothetical protein